MNRWVYDCEHGMEQYKSTKADPQKKWPAEWCEQCTLWEDNKCIGVAQCKRNIAALKQVMNEDLISRAEAIDALVKETKAEGAYGYIDATSVVHVISNLPSDDRSRGEQYKKGFEDAKRAFLVEYARESENMRKRNAQLEVMINAQKAISADRPKGEWIETAQDYYEAVNKKGGGVNENTEYFTDDIACSECLTKFSNIDNETERFNYCPNCGAVMRGEENE